jgi:hypothetical protein
MAGEAETPAPTAKRAAQHIRLSRIDGAYEHLCVLPLLSSLAPLHFYASRCTVASRFRRRSYERGYIFQGLQNGSLPPRSAL